MSLSPFYGIFMHETKLEKETKIFIIKHFGSVKYFNASD